MESFISDLEKERVKDVSDYLKKYKDASEETSN